jgi:hypothetical protein
MRKLRWMMLVGVLCGFAAAWLGGSCAIDDEVTWISGEQCSGTCTAGDPASLECDTDSSCTPAAGCVDWDCSEVPPGEDGLDSGLGDTCSDCGPEDAATDVPTASGSCTPVGGGLSQAAAAPLTWNVAATGLWACPETSQWFRIDVSAGTSFAIDFTPVDALDALAFVLYADDGTAIASADVTGTGGYAARAGATATYYLRVRALGVDDVEYAVRVGSVAR